MSAGGTSQPAAPVPAWGWRWVWRRCRPVAATATTARRGPTHQRTLFFNLSHEAYVGKTYYLTGGGRRFTLTPCAERPEVLARARLSNAFLRQVPDDQITHHVVDATFSSQSVTLCYVSSDLDVPAGTWSMSSVQLVIPPSGARFAYACARRTTPMVRCRCRPNAAATASARRPARRT